MYIARYQVVVKFYRDLYFIVPSIEAVSDESGDWTDIDLFLGKL